METAADRLIRDFEIGPRSGASGVQLLHRSFREVKRASRGVSLEVSSRAIPLDRVAPFRNLPLELNLGQHCCLWKINLNALTSGFDVTDIHQAGQRCGPEASD